MRLSRFLADTELAHARARTRFVAATLVAILAFAGSVSGAASPAAAATPVTSHAELQAGLDAGGTVTLGDNITGAGLRIPAPNDVVLELNGFSLTVQGAGSAGSPDGKAGIEVPVGASLTVNGPGILRATGGGGGAGIGGSDRGANGAITINGGTIEAIGGYRGAGIGTGDSAPAGAELVTINGGTVTALGGYIAAALGSGAMAVAPPITINGGTVRAGAELPYQGMGIGAGEQGIASTIRINSGEVWAAGRLWCGGTLGAWASDIGGVCVPNAPVDITIGATAVVHLLAAHDYGAITSVVQFSREGEGSFRNAGTINVLNARLTFPAGSTASNSGTINGPIVGPLSGNNYVLSFNDAGGSGGPGSVRVLAATLSAGRHGRPCRTHQGGVHLRGLVVGGDGRKPTHDHDGAEHQHVACPLAGAGASGHLRLGGGKRRRGDRGRGGFDIRPPHPADEVESHVRRLVHGRLGRHGVDIVDPRHGCDDLVRALDAQYLHGVVRHRHGGQCGAFADDRSWRHGGSALGGAHSHRAHLRRMGDDGRRLDGVGCDSRGDL
nr:hypothetical protein [Salinibacterium sp. dk2585]